MYNGLQTPRGSGTNGYVQANKFFLKPRPARADTAASASASASASAFDAPKKPNREILDHDRKRRLELQLLLLTETLADHGYTQSEIAVKVDEARKAFAAADDDGAAAPPPPGKRCLP